MRDNWFTWRGKKKDMFYNWIFISLHEIQRQIKKEKHICFCQRLEHQAAWWRKAFSEKIFRAKWLSKTFEIESGDKYLYNVTTEKTIKNLELEFCMSISQWFENVKAKFTIYISHITEKFETVRIHDFQLYKNLQIKKFKVQHFWLFMKEQIDLPERHRKSSAVITITVNVKLRVSLGLVSLCKMNEMRYYF